MISTHVGHQLSFPVKANPVFVFHLRLQVRGGGKTSQSEIPPWSSSNFVSSRNALGLRKAASVMAGSHLPLMHGRISAHSLSQPSSAVTEHQKQESFFGNSSTRRRLNVGGKQWGGCRGEGPGWWGGGVGGGAGAGGAVPQVST